MIDDATEWLNREPRVGVWMHRDYIHLQTGMTLTVKGENDELSIIREDGTIHAQIYAETLTPEAVDEILIDGGCEVLGDVVINETALAKLIALEPLNYNPPFYMSERSYDLEDRLALLEKNNVNLAELWCELNHCIVPGVLDDIIETEQHAWHAMNSISRKISIKECLRVWNRIVQGWTDEQFEEFWCKYDLNITGFPIPEAPKDEDLIYTALRESTSLPKEVNISELQQEAPTIGDKKWQIKRNLNT